MSLPVVHCITNGVTVARVFDALAAVGTSPILGSDPNEAGEVARRAQAVVLNCGNPSPDRFAALGAALDGANAARVPVVLDPVGCGATAWRTEPIRALAARGRIAVVRGNASEVACLAGLRDVPALHGVTAAAVDDETLERVAIDAARALGTVVLVTGRGHDVLAGAGAPRRLVVGAPILGDVIGGGDVLSALVGAWLARGLAPTEAAIAAHAAFAEAARSARPAGPASFWVVFIDALAAPRG